MEADIKAPSTAILKEIMSKAISALRPTILVLTMAFPAIYSQAANEERVPIKLGSDFISFSIDGDHGISGETISFVDKLPTFDGRLGSLDKIYLNVSTFYNVGQSSYYPTGSLEYIGSYETQLKFALGRWAIDTTSGASIIDISQEGSATVTGSKCPEELPNCNVGSWAPFSFPEQFEYTFIAARAASTGIFLSSDPIPVTALTVNYDQGMHLGATYRWGGTINLNKTYTAFTASQYVENAVGRANAQTPYDRAWQAADETLKLRQSDAVTSSKNEALRDAEYAFIGFTGAMDFRKDKSLETTLGLIGRGPLGVPLYNLAKGCAKLSNYCAAMLDWIAPKGPNDLPGTDPGGSSINAKAWLYGLLNPDGIDGLARVVKDGIISEAFQFQKKTISDDGITSDQRIGIENAVGNGQMQRLPNFGTLSEPSSIPLMKMNASNVSETQTENLSFLVAATDRHFTRLAIPLMEGSQNVDSFSLIVDGVAYQLLGSQIYDLEQLTGHMINGFFLTNISGTLHADGLIIDVAFDSAGTTTIFQMTTVQAVPEVNTSVFMVLGLAGLGLVGTRRRWRRSHAANAS